MIERERSAALPSPKDALELHLLRDLRAVGLPEPTRELHFMWCCEHPKKEHEVRPETQGRPGETFTVCPGCRGVREKKPRPLAGNWVHDIVRGRAWRFDLCWPAESLAVEVDGGTFSGGRHTRGQGYANDCEKLNEAVLRGWRILRVTGAQLESGEALEWIERAFGRKADGVATPDVRDL